MLPTFRIPLPSHPRRTGLFCPQTSCSVLPAPPPVALWSRRCLTCLQNYPLGLSSPLVFPRLCFSFLCPSLSSCWASAHSLCLVWLVPAMARLRALQGQVWFLSTVGHPGVMRSGAREMAVTQMVSSPARQELRWKPFDPSCQVGMWFGGGKGSPCSQGLSPTGLREGVPLLSQGWRPRSALEDHCRGCREVAALFSCLRHLELLGAPTWSIPGLPTPQSDEGLTWQHWARGLRLSSDGARLS